MKKFEEDVPLPKSLDVSTVSDSAIPSDEFEVEMLRCGHDRSVVNLCQPLQLPGLLDDGKVQWIDSVIQRIVHHPENLFRSGLYSALLREIQGFGQDYGWDYDSCLSRIGPVVGDSSS